MSDSGANNKLLGSRIQQLSESVGYGNLELTAAVSGFQAFDDVFSVGERCYYALFGGLSWEVGVGTLVGALELERTVVLDSSNGGHKLNLSGLSKVVVCATCPDAFYEPEQNVLTSLLSRAALGTFQTVSDTGYFVYAGKALSGLFLQSFVECHVTTGGTGAQTADLGIFTTVTAPDKTAMTLTKFLTTATVDSLTTTGVKRNTASFNTATSQPRHYWVGIRTAMATAQPIFAGLAGDMTQGHILIKAACGAFASLGSTFSTSLPAIGTATVAPDLRYSTI